MGAVVAERTNRRTMYGRERAGRGEAQEDAREALPEGGSLLVCEPMSGTPGAEAIGDAYYGLYLAAMGKGRSRTPAELTALLRSAGFAEVRLLPTPLPLQTRVLLARPAARSPSR